MATPRAISAENGNTELHACPPEDRVLFDVSDSIRLHDARYWTEKFRYVLPISVMLQQLRLLVSQVNAVHLFTILICG